jgi:hypothetical protein
MNVVANGAQVAGAAAIDDQGLVTAAKEVAEVFVATIEARCVRAEQPLHARDQVGAVRLDNEMKVIAHEAIGMDLPCGLGAGLAQSFEESFAILVIAENIFTPIAATHDMINRAFVLHPQLSSHKCRTTIANWRRSCNPCLLSFST